jgi:predicted P-loop ATPase/GTPase
LNPGLHMGTAESICSIWVVGDNTNVGKTTISTALIRALNRLGSPTVGFKPYAGTSLQDVIALLQEIARGDGYLVGRDARQLLAASPMMTEDMLELINPSWRISHPTRGVGVLIRKGSAAIGQRYFRHTENARALLSRPDFLRLNESMRLPLSEPLKNMDPDVIDFADQSVQAASFARLMALKPGSVVCEGAGRLLPVWQGAPAARHVFLVSGGTLYFFAHLNLQVPPMPGRWGPCTLQTVAAQLMAARPMRADIPIASPDSLAQVMDEFVDRFARMCLP